MDDRRAMSDRELLIRIDERMETATSRLDDHGRRLRVLERTATIATGLFFLAVVAAEGARDSLSHWIKHWIAQ